MSQEDDTAQDRAARRRAWPGRVTRLGEEPRDAPLPAAQALAAMPILALRAWRLTGAPLPSYSRAEMPGVMRRGAGPR